MEYKKIEYYKIQIEEKIFSEFDTFGSLIEILNKMKADGINKVIAYGILEELRVSEKVQQNERFENVILDLMDIIYRNCIPQHYIW